MNSYCYQYIFIVSETNSTYQPQGFLLITGFTIVINSMFIDWLL